MLTILGLKNQQRIITAMLKKMTTERFEPVVDKKMWVAMLEAAGMDEAAMVRWHAQFEQLAPKAHHDFLRQLGISAHEASRIQAWAKDKADGA